MKEISINDYNYDLPENRIAQYPVTERDSSKLLIYCQGKITQNIFRNIDESIPADSLLVFNNTRVIRARILFRKDTGAMIEVLCLEPLSPSEYELSFSSCTSVEWKCIIGNLKKWKTGEIHTSFIYNGENYKLTAQKIHPEGDTWMIRFKWNCQSISFGEVIEATGHIPLPPYINREDEAEDIKRYQTVYSRIKGSVAAPTAGLHFTETVFEKLKKKGIKTTEVTLHVGAGTFQPIKSDNIFDHEMHCEHFFISIDTLDIIKNNLGKIISVGTTSVRTLESLYWLGVRLIRDPSAGSTDLAIGQWEADKTDLNFTAVESLEAIKRYLVINKLKNLSASTSIMVTPGYNFKIINGIITNFHQPKSTLLLLISAWTGNDWKSIYKYALDNDFRFLSYGDCSLLLKNI
jgi:S-adenosylmethionine:tRNA ribosyltransferase-isomerase